MAYKNSGAKMPWGAFQFVAVVGVATLAKLHQDRITILKVGNPAPNTWAPRGGTSNRSLFSR